MPQVPARAAAGQPATALASTNLAIKFLLELAALALLAYWGAVVGVGVWALVLAVAAPSLMIGLWGRFAAPRAARRLPTPVRIPFELGLFSLAAGAGFTAGAHSVAAIFVVAAVVNALVLTVFHQWDH